jgi:hypothetical protein
LLVFCQHNDIQNKYKIGYYGAELNTTIKNFIVQALREIKGKENVVVVKSFVSD